MGKRRCKTCGNLFEPKEAGDRYCSSLCKTAGCFISGGGDTSKPNSEVPQKPQKPKAKPVRTVGKDFPRVREMMELPPTDRWRIAKDFTEEEKAYSRKMARKSLLDDRAAEIISDWDGGEDDEEDLILGQMDKLGESDDGSV